MADVDFSNATMDVFGSAKPMIYADYLDLLSGITLRDDTFDVIYSRPTVSVLQNTPTKVSILFTGTMTTSGAKTSFVIGNASYETPFKVSNISFNNGDTYSFIIDIETSGS